MAARVHQCFTNVMPSGMEIVDGFALSSESPPEPVDQLGRWLDAVEAAKPEAGEVSALCRSHQIAVVSPHRSLRRSRHVTDGGDSANDTVTLAFRNTSVPMIAEPAGDHRYE